MCAFIQADRDVTANKISRDNSQLLAT